MQIVTNTEKKGIEVGFNSKPSDAIIEGLKRNGFRWHFKKKVWYAKDTDATRYFLSGIANGDLPSPVNKDAAPFELTEKNLIACLNLEAWKTGKVSDIACITRGIKSFLKKAGIACTARSSSYSMGDSVNVETEDIAYKTEKTLNELFKIFEMGHFNGMEDIYEYDTCRKDIPQTKYFFYANRWSEDYTAAIDKKLIEKYGEDFMERCPDLYRFRQDMHEGKD